MTRWTLSAWAGAILVLLGVFVMGGVWLHAAPFLWLLPGFTPMVFSSALCFVLAGSALFTVVSGRPGLHRLTSAFALTLGVFALLTLVEYLTGVDFGIDWPSIHAWLPDGSPAPGRM